MKVNGDICVTVFVQRAFLPTMPDDMLAVAQQAMGPLQWYCKYKSAICEKPTIAIIIIINGYLNVVTIYSCNYNC